MVPRHHTIFRDLKYEDPRVVAKSGTVLDMALALALARRDDVRVIAQCRSTDEKGMMIAVAVALIQESAISRLSSMPL